MLKSIIEACLIILCVVFLLPVMAMLFVWTAIYGVLLIPLAGIAYLVWRFIQRKGWLNGLNEPIPSYAIPVEEKPIRKPIMIKWQGKEIPLLVFIISLCISIVLVPVVLFFMVFYIPPFWTVMIIAVMIGKGIAKASKKGVVNG